MALVRSLATGEVRQQLEALNLDAIYWRTPETFDDGEALFEAVCDRGLEGVVAKRVEGHYRPGNAPGRS